MPMLRQQIVHPKHNVTFLRKPINSATAMFTQFLTEEFEVWLIKEVDQNQGLVTTKMLIKTNG